MLKEATFLSLFWQADVLVNRCSNLLELFFFQDPIGPDVVFTKAPKKTNGFPVLEWESNKIANFECSLDNSPYEACGRGQRYRWTRPNMVDGLHTLKVRAIDNEGNVGRLAIHSWIVGKTAFILF